MRTSRSILPRELVAVLPLHAVKVELVQLLAVQTRVGEADGDLIRGFDWADAARSAGEDQVTFL
jgi:hypothetical protein